MNRTCLTFPAVKDFIRQRFRNFLNNCIQFYEPNISLIFYDDLDPWGADPAGLKYIICTIWLFVVNYFGFFIMKLKYAVILIFNESVCLLMTNRAYMSAAKEDDRVF